jgi:hypothetical protein
LPPSLELELRAVLARLAAAAKPAAAIKRAYSLGSGVALLVESQALLDVRAEIAQRFERHLTPQDSHEVRLHITIQNKVAPGVARATLNEVAAVITPRALEIAALACWHYRGGPWSPIARYAFRG